MEYENIIFDPELLGGAGDLCAEKYILPLQSGRLALNVHLTPDDLYYPQAANCLKEIEDANSSKLPGYELVIKSGLLRFLALLILHGKQQLPAETADTRRLKTVLPMDFGTLCPKDLRCRCSRSMFFQLQPFHAVVPADDGAELYRFSEEHRLNTAAMHYRPRMKRS